MEDRETARMRKYGESKTTRIMMALYRTSLPVWDFLLTRVYNTNNTVYRNNENLGLDVTGCHGNWGVSHSGYLLRLTRVEDLDLYLGNET